MRQLPMAHTTPNVQELLDRLGLAVPAADLPFLQRTWLRQRELSLRLRAAVPPETEAAHVFMVQPQAATLSSAEAARPPLCGLSDA